MKKPVRSASGISVVTVVTMPQACPHGRCVYCPGGGDTPNSYTTVSPAIMRAKELAYDPAKQVEARLRALTVMGHPISKIEVIIIGGTFLHFPPGYCEKFIKSIFDSLNGTESSDLEVAQRINETSERRCVALCIETRPELCTAENIQTLLRFGVTRVELGVQALDDRIYKLVNRGHTVQDVINATRSLKDAGFKVGYHVMPGLPGSTPEKDITMFRMMFEDSAFQPDQLKIYPTQVVQGSELEQWHKEGTFKPYPDEVMIDLLCRLKVLVPPYCRIMRIQRQLSVDILKSGLWGDVRTEVHKRMKEREMECKCIRCKEIGFNKDAQGPWQIEMLSYYASSGREWFVTMQNHEGIIQGLVRCRTTPAVPGIMFIRELHVYGREVPVDGASVETQHKGIGRQLMAEAERIAKEQKCRKILIISGVGVRQYYRKIGYALERQYMAKGL
jgi:elongator complex protein 3